MPEQQRSPLFEVLLAPILTGLAVSVALFTANYWFNKEQSRAHLTRQIYSEYTSISMRDQRVAAHHYIKGGAARLIQDDYFRNPELWAQPGRLVSEDDDGVAAGNRALRNVLAHFAILRSYHENGLLDEGMMIAFYGKHFPKWGERFLSQLTAGGLLCSETRQELSATGPSGDSTLLESMARDLQSSLQSGKWREAERVVQAMCKRPGDDWIDWSLTTVWLIRMAQLVGH